MSKIAFVVLSHSNAPQLLRLTKTLARLYENTQIVCHHNFTLGPLDQNEFPGVCQFVHPHIDSRWGVFSLVRAGLSAIETLHRLDGWEWFFLLSGSDYPIAAPESVRRELLSADYDVLLDSRLVERDRGTVEGPDEHGEFSFMRPYWRSLAYDRYITHHISYPSLTKRLTPCKRRLSVRSPTLLRVLGKWPTNFRVYGGELWFGGNRRTAEVLLRHPEQRSILSFFNSKPNVAEAVYQTLICNSDLTVSRLGNRRFIKWPTLAAHPKWLGKENFSEITNSNAWFARKFWPEDPVLDLLDEHLLSNARI